MQLVKSWATSADRHLDIVDILCLRLSTAEQDMALCNGIHHRLFHPLMNTVENEAEAAVPGRTANYLEIKKQDSSIPRHCQMGISSTTQSSSADDPLQYSRYINKRALQSRHESFFPSAKKAGYSPFFFSSLEQCAIFLVQYHHLH